MKEIFEIEKQIDSLIEQREYEKILNLLFQREKLIKNLSSIDKKIAQTLVEADKVRIDKIKSHMAQIQQNALQTKNAESAIKLYRYISDSKGTRLDEKM
ncbi:hypothetical protein [Pseudothermotoga sp.]|uniref:hypothetical protein n=1 Tax=Pseudothermotoga sp. TaxID=2033661 RepID=UPI00258388A9|nr:hypothetical protein [Pseudothermotoga sp.]MDK2885155.1 hypothetical protein [Pseudothermotoga sp.]